VTRHLEVELHDPSPSTMLALVLIGGSLFVIGVGIGLALGAWL